MASRVHINADQTHKLIRAYTVANAAVHDSQAIDDLLNKKADANGNERAVYADSACRSVKNRRLTTAKSPSSERVEHVFGAQAQMGGHWGRAIDSLRAKVKIGMMNLMYNMMRLVQLAGRKEEVTPAIA